MMPDSLDQFNDALTEALSAESCVRLTLAAPVPGPEPLPRTQTARPVVIRQQQLWQWELQFEKQQHHLNLDADQTRQRVGEQLTANYREASLLTRDRKLTLRRSGAKWKLSIREVSGEAAPPVTDHDRRKQYLIPDGVPCPFLTALDVMSPAGRVHARAQKKFRQINRYLEIVNDVLSSLPAEGELRVVDLGCGLSYLTFAVHHLLTAIHHRPVRMLGIDRNPDVIARCRKIAEDLQLPGIEFEAGEIAATPAAGPLHLAISLHACDTATDAALTYAVSRSAAAILAAPCCQHELFTQFAAPGLETLTRHGVLKERMAALATDALRAAALEAAGYKTQVLEFIDLEHTPKNLLLRAIRRGGNLSPDESARRYVELKQQLGVTQLATDRILAGAPVHAP